MTKTLENLKDDELETGAERIRRYRAFIVRNAKHFPPAAALLVFAACARLGGAGVVFGLPLLPQAAFLAAGVVAALATVMVCCLALPPLLSALDSKCIRDLRRIDTEMKMRELERLPSFQAGLSKIAQRLANTFGVVAAKTFHEGTDEDITVKKPLQLKIPDASPRRKSLFGL